MDCLRADRSWDVVLIGCGKRKRTERSYAIDLYNGGVFRAHLAIAGHLGEEPWILSAEHGLIPPRRAIDPYEREIDDFSAEEVSRWNEQIRAGILRETGAVVGLPGHAGGSARDPALLLPLRERLAKMTPVEWRFGPVMQPRVLVLAGPRYVDGWAPALRALGVRVDDPLRGYTVPERRMFARRFLAETPAWRDGDDPDERGWTRAEQLDAFADAFDFERMEIGEPAAPDPQLGLW